MFTVGTANEATRVAWIESALRTVPSGQKLLDAGAGECQFRRFCGHLDYIAQDFAQYTGSGDVGLHTGGWDNGKLDIVCDITDIPLPDASIDAVMCTEVFEHLPNPVLAIQEFSRLIRPGGTLILTAPFFSLTHFAPYHFATGFNRYFFEHHLAEHGFVVDELVSNGNYFEAVAQELRRVGSIGVSHAGRKGSLLSKVAMLPMLWRLQNLSRTGNRSAELLSFGVHVRAHRI